MNNTLTRDPLDGSALLSVGDEPWPGGFCPDHQLNDALPQPEPEAPAIDFEPMTAPEFETLVRRLMLLRAERDAVDANAKAIVAEKDRQIEALLAEHDARLRHYVDGGHGAKSRRCIFGLVGIRKGGARPYIVDERLAVESVTELAPSALSVNLSRLPAHFTAPGFDISPETSKPYFQALPKTRKGAAPTEGDDSDV